MQNLFPQPGQLLVPEESLGWFHLLLLGSPSSKTKLIHHKSELSPDLKSIVGNIENTQDSSGLNGWVGQ